MTGFEPVTFCTQNKRATKLRYIPFQNCCTVSLYKIRVLFSTSLFYPPFISNFIVISSFWFHIIKELYTFETQPNV